MYIFEHEKYQRNLKWINEAIQNSSLNILITGATGLVGSCIVDALLYSNRYLNGNHKVYAASRNMDKLKSRFPYIQNGSEGIYFMEYDVCRPLETEMDIHYIIHAASNADPGSYTRYPSGTIVTNVIGMQNILEYARKRKGIQVLFTSTMEVYGQLEKDGKLTEEDYGRICFQDIRSGYPESKRVAELLCQSYVAEYQVPVKIARLGYIYGPTMLQTDNKVIAQFIRNAVLSQNICLKSRGIQKRSYCYVADAVQGLFHILFHGKMGESYNVADKNSITTIRELAETVAALGNRKVVFDIPDIEAKPNVSGMQYAVLDTEKIENLGWEAHYHLEDGLTQTIQIYSDCLC